ncbi:hypothetical protein DFH06DRAFT_1139742 [Mycena polygramma]|nr:hypothetical protein DFH06DRAFT_1139742 [Mycena polygramma]
MHPQPASDVQPFVPPRGHHFFLVVVFAVSGREGGVSELKRDGGKGGRDEGRGGRDEGGRTEPRGGNRGMDEGGEVTIKRGREEEGGTKAGGRNREGGIEGWTKEGKRRGSNDKKREGMRRWANEQTKPRVANIKRGAGGGR